jgi:NDP-sugar pyrophosphorylase family protein
MKVSDLFSAETEPVLNEWMRRFTSLDEMFSAMPQLYSKLKSQDIQGTVEEGAVIIGLVHIGMAAVVHAHAIIHGPSIVGCDTVVNSHAEIQSGSFIGSKCVIGHSCSIIKSMIMNNVSVWASAYVRNSVIGYGSVIGPGAALGADEVQSWGRMSQMSSKLGVVLGDYAVVGANSTIKPGTVIGSRTIIGQGVVANGIYEANQTVTFRQALDIKPRRDRS